jgi:hypothetical protein
MAGGRQGEEPAEYGAFLFRNHSVQVWKRFFRTGSLEHPSLFPDVPNSLRTAERIGLDQGLISDRRFLTRDRRYHIRTLDPLPAPAVLLTGLILFLGSDFWEGRVLIENRSKSI